MCTQTNVSKSYKTEFKVKLPHFSPCFYLQNKSSIVLSSSRLSDSWSLLCCCRPVMDSPKICDSQAGWLSKALPKNLHICTVTRTDPSPLRHTYSPKSHKLPSQPSGQKHWKELIPSMHVPPFLQGDDAQSLMSAGGERREMYRCQVNNLIFWTFFVLFCSWIRALLLLSYI